MPENPLSSLHLEADAQEFGRLFKLPPEQAIAAWEKRIAAQVPTPAQRERASRGVPNPQVPWKSTDVLWHGHSRGFFVARMTRADLLADIHREVERALKEGRTFEAFRKDLEPILRTKGWWSGDEPGEVSQVRNPRTGADEWARLGTPRRLKTIYQTNLSVSYHAGRYRAMDQVADLLPFVQYHTLDHGPNRRPPHQLLDGRVFRANDPVLSSIRPPNGWGCQCDLSPLTEAMARRLGPLPEAAEVVTRTERVGDQEVEVQGVRVGGSTMFPDPQWSYDLVGHDQALETLAWSKIRALPDAARKAMVDSIASHPKLLDDRSRHWKAWVQGVGDSRRGNVRDDDAVAMGWLPSDIMAALSGKTTVHGQAVTHPVTIATSKQVLHSLRPMKNPAQAVGPAIMERLPTLLAQATRWYWDGKLLAYSRLEGDVWVKIVFDVRKDGILSLDTVSKVLASALKSTGEML